MERAVLRQGWLGARERLPTHIFLDSEDVSRVVAGEIATLIRRRQAEGRQCVLGLATGSTPMHVYRELVRMHREEGLSFSNVQTFNLDEYHPMQPQAQQSYHRFMAEHLFDHVDLPPGAVHIPDGTVPLADVARHCQEYERRIEEAGGIDLQLLGLGRTGHIGFNERGSSRASTTRLVTLDRVTRVDAASDFFGEDSVPRRAITMGVATILKARRVLLMAFGENKAGVVRLAVEGPVSEQVAASYLQEHPDATAFVDYAAAAGLTRVQSPWVLGPIAWDTTQVKKAACWLSQKVGKPVLKLTDDDYFEHGLQDLVGSEWGPAYDINLRVFYALQGTISGWPGGKPSGHPGKGPDPAVAAGTSGKGVQAASGNISDRSEEGQRIPALRQAPGGDRAGEAAEGSNQGAAGSAIQLARRYTDHGLPPGRVQGSEGGSASPKRVLVMSPHPDDDVISMGGTLIRLVDQGHEVHVGYQTSGNIAVRDEDVRCFADFAVQFGGIVGLDTSLTAEAASRIEAALRDKAPGEVDNEEVLQTKALIRQCEARSGQVVKSPLSQPDIDLLVALFDRIRPHQIYAAGDLSDPHGTHRTCLQVIFQTLDVVRERDWYRQCGTDVLLYRGAWQEWEPWEVDLAVPLSPAELQQKVDAIHKHQSQKDRALFPGADPREFWQRAQDRNRATAALYDSLGLAEYEAVEAFVCYLPHNPTRLFHLPTTEAAAEG